MAPSPKKLDGKLYYDHAPIQLTEAIRPDNKKITFDYEENGWKYTVTIAKKDETKTYSGKYIARKGSETEEGAVQANYFIRDNESWLIGIIDEEDVEYGFWIKFEEKQ